MGRAGWCWGAMVPSVLRGEGHSHPGDRPLGVGNCPGASGGVERVQDTCWLYLSATEQEACHDTGPHVQLQSRPACACF